VTRAKS